MQNSSRDSLIAMVAAQTTHVCGSNQITRFCFEVNFKMPSSEATSCLSIPVFQWVLH